jgi:hypothetical protein
MDLFHAKAPSLSPVREGSHPMWEEEIIASDLPFHGHASAWKRWNATDAMTLNLSLRTGSAWLSYRR